MELSSIQSIFILIIFSTLWSVGQAVKTPPFHGGITGSIPVRIIVSSMMEV